MKTALYLTLLLVFVACGKMTPQSAQGYSVEGQAFNERTADTPQGFSLDPVASELDQKNYPIPTLPPSIPSGVLQEKSQTSNSAAPDKSTGPVTSAPSAASLPAKSGSADPTRKTSPNLPDLLEQAVGYYNSSNPFKVLFGAPKGGSLVNGTQLPLSGPGYVKVDPSRERYWGTREIIGLIIFVAKQMMANFPGSSPMRVGDISSRYGGKSTHQSHQNGLDVDIKFFSTRDSIALTPEGLKERFVSQGQISPYFDYKKNWMLLKWFASSNLVREIYADRVIKNKLCLYSKSIGEFERYQGVLRLLKHEPRHEDHLHVRLFCPQSSPRCIGPKEPRGDKDPGC